MNHIMTYVISTRNFEKNLSDSENIKNRELRAGFLLGKGSMFNSNKKKSGIFKIWSDPPTPPL